MVRSAAAVLAVLIIPSFALAQEPQGTHVVVKDDTLWDLAQRYYSNPFEWRVLWEANRGVVEDPNWIYPAEVLVIPGLPGDEDPAPDVPMEEPPQDPPAADPDVDPDFAPVPADLIPFGLRQARASDEARTIFFKDRAGARLTIQQSGAATYVSVSADAVYSAPWLIGLESDAGNDGHISGFADREARASTIRSFNEVTIVMPSSVRVGARLQIYRMDGTIEDVGQVMRPTGVVTVTTIGDGEVVGVVTKEYDRIQPGDFVRALPSYSPRAGEYAEPVSSGSEAMVMGFAGTQVLTDIGHIAFLDLGSDDGIKIGDEFILYGEAIPTNRDGALQVVAVTETMASARVLSMADNVFHQGVIVRLAKKMR